MSEVTTEQTEAIVKDRARIREGLKELRKIEVPAHTYREGVVLDSPVTCVQLGEVLALLTPNIMEAED